MEKSSHRKDPQALLDEILLRARRLIRADAGSLYLIENNSLNFSYIHNDTLFGASGLKRQLYQNQALPVDNHSLAGYVALTGEPLIIDDAYHLPAGKPFAFNDAFDHLAGYRTQSVLVAPLVTSSHKTVGVMQFINPLQDDRQPVAFTPGDLLRVRQCADDAVAAIERAGLTREVVSRLIEMPRRRDPRDTGAHANRVGAYAAEIYHQWGLKQGLAGDDIRRNKNLLRIAAMLHDLGKGAVSDRILKKPAGLDAEEFRIMQYHTIHGARLFQNQESALDVLCAEIALNHHEKWDGTGYPGKIDDIYQDQFSVGAGKQKEEIPLGARIVALADVYDALVTRRAYKSPWSETMTLNYIKDQSGKHFDPEVVDSFLAIYDVIAAIREKYQEPDSSSRLTASPEPPGSPPTQKS